LIFGYLGIALSIAIAVDVVFMLAIALLESILSRLRGMSVVYDRSGAANEEGAV
jgi:hypothetical protein